jgi:hypothetical protein
MTAFFVPGARSGVHAVRAHDELRRLTEERTGRVTRRTRICALTSRRQGADSETRVGADDPCTGEQVQAIFATTEGYTVVWDGGHVDLTKRQVYEAIQFDA